MKNIYVVYTQDGPEHPHMHSVHATKELAEIAKLIVIHQEKTYLGEDYIPEHAPDVFVREEPLISSYGDLEKIFHQSYVWDVQITKAIHGPTEGE